MSLSYLFQIYTATPLVFTHMYRVFICVVIKYLGWCCCEIQMYTKIPLRLENKEVKVGSATWSPGCGSAKGTCYQLKYCEKTNKPTNQPNNDNRNNRKKSKNRPTTTTLNGAFSRHKLEKTNTMQGHVIGTGVSAPLLPSRVFGKAGL